MKIETTEKYTFEVGDVFWDASTKKCCVIRWISPEKGKIAFVGYTAHYTSATLESAIKNGTYTYAGSVPKLSPEVSDPALAIDDLP